MADIVDKNHGVPNKNSPICDEYEHIWAGDGARRPKHDRFPWNAQEVERTAELKDEFGYIRFKVYLYASFKEIAVARPGEEGSTTYKFRQYEVSTTSLMYGKEETLIFTSNKFERLSDAEKCYFENIDRYSMILKAEIQHCQNIEIYAQKIGYHLSERCCANCRWSAQKMHGCKLQFPPKDECQIHFDPRKHKHEFVCTNCKLFAPRMTDLGKRDYDQSKIQPEIKPEYVCDFFEKKLPPNDPDFKNHAYDQYGEEIFDRLKRRRKHEC